MSQMPSVDRSIATTGNWIPDVNRFDLPQPPAWFLKVLWDQDAGLVILPSRQTPKYLVARRRDRSRSMAVILEKQLEVNDRVHKRVPHSDSDMLREHKAVLVDSITGNVYWGSWMRSCPAMLQELRSRDMWAAGGAEQYIKDLEAREAGEQDKRRRSLADDLEHRAADAWRSYQARTGARNQHARLGGSVKIQKVGTLTGSSGSFFA